MKKIVGPQHITDKPVDFVAYLVCHIQSKVNDKAAWQNKVASYAQQKNTM